MTVGQENRIELGPVYFRPITLEDTDRIIRWRNSDRVRKNFIYQEPFTRQGHLNWMETKVASGEVVQFILCETKGDRAVGSVYIRDIDRKNRKGEYGIFIGEADAAGKGYGTLAAKGAIAYAGDILHLHKLFLRVFADNAAALRSYEKAGFVREAILKDEIRNGDGSWRDLILMAVLFPEN
ncbi:MAG TPA: GNAT family N-acetyltransferase [Candidatus Eisenbergiella merdipullorum]|uniref:GNAT family N-acetyltransferase n=1 Tax=Candidatus Eisenbergiella merdipullorum TaxID=2838553 RepID=A0A9D2KXV4_9FIRM|nr:GNAT family N-acetyltransferase [Candidatus Eisenbergiella merdipullorum]